MQNKRTLDSATDADIVIFDLDRCYTIDSAQNESNSKFSIYNGRTIRGAVEKTFLRGNLIADRGDIVVDTHLDGSLTGSYLSGIRNTKPYKRATRLASVPAVINMGHQPASSSVTPFSKTFIRIAKIAVAGG